MLSPLVASPTAPMTERRRDRQGYYARALSPRWAGRPHAASRRRTAARALEALHHVVDLGRIHLGASRLGHGHVVGLHACHRGIHGGLVSPEDDGYAFDAGRVAQDVHTLAALGG